MSLILKANAGGDFKPHPEGIFPAVCVDVIDLGTHLTTYQGEKRLRAMVELVFETEQRGEDGKNLVIGRQFTASLNPKAKLTEFLAKWRGRPVGGTEEMDLEKLMGVNCTLVISHQQSTSGRTYGSIDAVSKPTKKLAPSGGYDAAAYRKRSMDRLTKDAEATGASSAPGAASAKAPVVAAPSARPPHPVVAPASVNEDFDPDIGF